MAAEDTERPARRLADEMRRIIHALTLVRPPAADLAAAAETASAFADRLEALPARPLTTEIREAGLNPRDFVEHSPVSGRSNPLAPPLFMRLSSEPSAPDRPVGIEGTVTFGAAYEGPPAHVHGGYVAAMFDELLGYAQMEPGFTGTLTVRYRRPTPLERELRLVAWIDWTRERKRLVKGECTLDGVLLAEAEGLFIKPRGNELKGLVKPPEPGG